jgi:hypothetical protein
MRLQEHQLQIRHHKQLTKKRTIGVTAFERSVAKQFPTGGFKPGSRVHQPRTCPRKVLISTNKYKLPW